MRKQNRLKSKTVVQKLTAFLLGAALFAAPLCGFCEQSYFTAKFNAETKTVDISSAGYTSKGEAVIVHIAPKGDNHVLSASNLPTVSDLFFAKDDGSLSISFPLRDDFDSDKYVVSVGIAGQTAPLTEQVIIINEKSDATKNALKAVNGAKNTTDFAKAVRDGGIALGIDLEAETALDNMLPIMYGVKEAEKEDLSFEIFSKSTDYARAALAFKNGTAADDVMKKYASAFSTTYDAYTALDSSVKEELGGLLAQADFTKGFIAYKSFVAVATVRSAGDYGSMRDYMTTSENAKLFEIDTDGDYADLSVNNRSKVFVELFDMRKSFQTAEDVAKAFEKTVKDIAADAKKESNKKGSSGSGAGKLSGSLTYEEPTSEVAPLPETPASGNDSNFSDIGGHFAEKEIKELVERGILNGFDNGTFGPNLSVSRAQLCKMLVLSFRLQESAKSTFDDVAEDNWSYPYISVLAQKDIVRGDGKAFRPDESVTRQDAAVMIARTLKQSGLLQEGQYSFTDSGDIDDYAAESVGALAASGILRGDGVNFMPKRDMTRAEVAVILSRLVNAVK